jgi:predicted type IV restriction endonuclease
MSPELEEFRQKILNHATLVVGRAPRVDNEARTNASLIQPFLTALGYDVGNPDEVSPEHHADFSEKYQNKVDYAILHQGVPVIALESKRVGAVLKDDRGQLRSYFNACQTIKLGILTDGLKYELYADSDKPNMMDETAFLRFNFAEIAKNGAIDDNTLGGIAAIRKGFFNPEDVGAEAKRKLLFESVVETIKQFKSDPSAEFIRFVLGHSAVRGKISKLTQAIVDANRDMIRSAMEAFVAQEALARFGYAPKDLVRTPPAELAANGAPVAAPEPEAEGSSPSEGEMNAFTYARNRLFFLVRNEVLFQEAQKITFRKTKTSFRVYYGRPNNGSLFDYREHRDGTVSLQFPPLASRDIVYACSPELDDCLLKAFSQRLTEAGIPFESTPVLRAIQGGH